MVQSAPPPRRQMKPQTATIGECHGHPLGLSRYYVEKFVCIPPSAIKGHLQEHRSIPWPRIHAPTMYT